MLLETYLPGREFTVGLAGTGERAKVLAVMEILHRPGAEAGGYTYANKADFGACVRYALATDGTARLAAAMALRAWRFIGGRDAGRVDLRCDTNGNPHFLEVNPLAGLHPEDSDLPILCRLSGIRVRRPGRLDPALRLPAPAAITALKRAHGARSLA